MIAGENLSKFVLRDRQCTLKIYDMCLLPKLLLFLCSQCLITTQYCPQQEYRKNSMNIIHAYNIFSALQRLELTNSLESRMADGLSEQKKEQQQRKYYCQE